MAAWRYEISLRVLNITRRQIHVISSKTNSCNILYIFHDTIFCRTSYQIPVILAAHSILFQKFGKTLLLV